MWNNGYALEELNEKADQALSRSCPFISNLAQTYQVDIVAGSVSNKRNNKVYNTAFTVSKEGRRINKYDKVHLVPMLNEPELQKMEKQFQNHLLYHQVRSPLNML